MRLQRGDKIRGFCGGFLGRDAYGEHTVVASDTDWVLVRVSSYLVVAESDEWGNIHDTIVRFADEIERV